MRLILEPAARARIKPRSATGRDRPLGRIWRESGQADLLPLITDLAQQLGDGCSGAPARNPVDNQCVLTLCFLKLACRPERF